MPLCTGGNTGYISTGSQVKATWQGLIDSIILTQITTLDTGSLYFTTQIILTNIASTPANDIYYLRTLDPDNEESWTGNFATINTITHQAVDTTVVTATGPSSPLSYMALGTTFDSATAFIGHNR
jgi:hypothetical protein